MHSVSYWPENKRIRCVSGRVGLKRQDFVDIKPCVRHTLRVFSLIIKWRQKSVHTYSINAAQAESSQYPVPIPDQTFAMCSNAGQKLCLSWNKTDISKIEGGAVDCCGAVSEFSKEFVAAMDMIRRMQSAALSDEWVDILSRPPVSPATVDYYVSIIPQRR